MKFSFVLQESNGLNGSLRRAHSEELLSEVGLDQEEEEPQKSSNKTPAGVRKTSILDSTGLLQVSDHPRMRHNSAGDTTTNADENNYENFAHELSAGDNSSYLWHPLMTNTRELSMSNTKNQQNDNSKIPPNIDLNSTNSDSCSHRSMSSADHHNNSASGVLLSVNSRPNSCSVSPERRLDMVLGSEHSIQFSDHTPCSLTNQMARPIPTFSSFGLIQEPEVHRARPAYAPTPSPGGSEECQTVGLPPPLPARQLQLLQQQQQQSPQSLPFFPFHQFPGRSVKPMCKYLIIYFIHSKAKVLSFAVKGPKFCSERS
jgi:hypothetical protein